MRHLLLPSLILTLGLTFLLPPAYATQTPQLSGVVQKDGNDPLRKARVELLAETSKKVLAYTYTNDRGAFAFRKLQPRVYRVQVRLGDIVLWQSNEKREELLSQKIRVTEKPARLKIVVRLKR